MFTTVKTGNVYVARYKEIVCNTTDELSNIDRQKIAPGSKAIVLTADGKEQRYILSNSREWIVQRVNQGSSEEYSKWEGGSY